MRLQSLIDRSKVIITEDTIRKALHSDDAAGGCIQIEGKITELDVDEDVTLEEVDVEVTMDADVQGRLEESQAKCSKEKEGVIIQEPEETATASVIVHSKAKSKDKGKVKRKEKQDDTVMRYQALKRKPVIESQARKNMMIYLKNMAGFKMDFFRGMTYNEIRPIFEKHYNLNQAFLERVKEEIVANDDDDVYTKATPLALKVHVVDYQIHHEHNKPYYKIIRADGTHQLFLSFITLLKNFNKEDLEMLWKLVQERFQSSEPKNFLDDFLLNTLKIMFKKPNVEAII
uniref:Uncharacterized protein n=1 Tax=Tanacetum cinerariifolium TaxID=118510 RepID=A0A6L2NZF6_TANCI|nr:hypothetical protein [Tanacetum cinerariifolium]